jgi:nitrogen fixation protein NifB
MHLPVAPACNIQCNYCNRLYDCVNESRPGVTSEILSPEQALAKIEVVQSRLDNLAVIGIAGPGDALANWEKTRATLVGIKEKYPDLIPCLSTNGLLLPQYAEELIKLGVGHVTVTVNSIDPILSEKIYAYVEWEGVRLKGQAAMQKLLDNQMAGIKLLAKHGIMIKVNIVMIPGINDGHIPAVVAAVKEAGASLTNIMPLIPASGSGFAHLPQTSNRDVTTMRDKCQTLLPQMRHCRQCRADAIGLLAQDRSAEFRDIPTCPSGGCSTDGHKYRVAVTSKYEKLVDLHFGHANSFLIYETDGVNSFLVERRSTVKYCHGNDYCEGEENYKLEVVKKLADCAAVVTMRIGSQAKERLSGEGILAVEACNEIAAGLALAVEQLTLKKAG